MLEESKSPYRKPVTWARDQVQRETVKLQEEHLKQQVYDKNGRKTSRQKTPKPITEEEYENLKLRGPKNLCDLLDASVQLQRWPEVLNKNDNCKSPWEREKPVRVLETGVEDANEGGFGDVHRWPESEKHIPGGIPPWLPKNDTRKDPDAELDQEKLGFDLKRWPENKHVMNVLQWNNSSTPSKLQSLQQPFANTLYRKADIEARQKELEEMNKPKKQKTPSRPTSKYLSFPKIGNEPPTLEEELSLSEEEMKAVTIIRRKLIEAMIDDPRLEAGGHPTELEEAGIYYDYDESFGESSRFVNIPSQVHPMTNNNEGNLPFGSPAHATNHQKPKPSMFSPDRTTQKARTITSAKRKVEQQNNNNLFSPKSPERRKNSPRSSFKSPVHPSVVARTSNNSNKKTPSKPNDGNKRNKSPDSNIQFPETRMSPRELRKYKNRLQHPLQTPPPAQVSTSPAPLPNSTAIIQDHSSLAQNLLESFQQSEALPSTQHQHQQVSTVNNPHNNSTTTITVMRMVNDENNVNHSNIFKGIFGSGNLKDQITKKEVNSNLLSIPKNVIEMSTFKTETVTNPEFALVRPKSATVAVTPSVPSSNPANQHHITQFSNQFISEFFSNQLPTIISSSPYFMKESTLVMKNPSPQQIALIRQTSSSKLYDDAGHLLSPVPPSGSLTPLQQSVEKPLNEKFSQKRAFLNEVENKQKNFMSPVPSFLSELKNNQGLKFQLKKTVPKKPEVAEADNGDEHRHQQEIHEQETKQEHKLSFEKFLAEMNDLKIPQFLLNFHSLAESISNLSPFQSKSNLFEGTENPHTSNANPSILSSLSKSDSLQKLNHVDNPNPLKKLSYDSVSLLGRGKFASVYCVQNKQKISFPDCNQNSDIHTRDLLALKIAQFKDNDLATTHTATHSAVNTPASTSNLRFSYEHSTNTNFSPRYPSKAIIEEFRREIISLHHLQKHPNVNNLIGYSLQPFGIVMDYVSGQNLYVLLHNEHWQQSQTVSSRLQILTDIVSGLVHIHSQCYIHRDIKPHNIVIEQNKEGKITSAKIVDFGTAFKLSFPPLKYSKSMKGCEEPTGTSGYSGNPYFCFFLLHLINTPFFVAPEIFSHSENPLINYAYPADVFSFSILLWEMMISDSSKIINPLQGLNPNSAFDEVRTFLPFDFTVLLKLVYSVDEKW
jgi:hypothetical protein